MPVRKNRHGKYMIDVVFKHADGRRERVREVSPVQTKAGAAAYELQVRRALLEGTRANVETPTLAEFEDEFLAACRGRGNKPRDTKAKEQILRDHLLPALGRRRLDGIDERSIDLYRDHKLGAGELAPKTVRNHLEVLRRMLNVAHRRGLVSSVPRIEMPKKPEAEPNFFTFEEAERFLDAARSEWRAVFFVAMRTGLRLGELKGLRWRDLDLQRSLMRLRVQRDDDGTVSTLKSNRARSIELAWDVVDVLRGITRGGEYVFGDIVTDRSAWWAVSSTAKRAGIGRHFSPHDLRHTFGAHCIMRGVDIVTLQGWMGHSDVKTTMVYAHVCGTHREGQADKLAGGPRPLRVLQGGAESRHPEGTPHGAIAKTGP